MCDHLLAEGHSVVALDNFLSGSPCNLSHIAAGPYFELIRQDITQPLL